MESSLQDKLIVALDLASTEEAEELVAKLGNEISFYKIGLSLVPVGGFELAMKLKNLGKKVFLDLKLFDIGYTIENTVKSLSHLNIDFLTVHGDPQIVRAASKSARETNTKILAVTLLTSLDRQDLDDSLIRDGNITDLASERARNAFNAGADGVIASPNESKKIRQLTESKGRLIVSPGIRLKPDPQDDQKRTSDPQTAFKSGSDYIVVGRPILAAENPLEEIKKFTLSF